MNYEITQELAKSGHQLAVLLGTQHGMLDAASLVQRLTAQLDCTTVAMREMTKQRDELLAALEAFAAAQDAKRAAQGKGAGPIAAAISDLIIAEEKARAAIARVKGGAA